MTGTENLLGNFLRARRDLIDPRELNLPDFGRRRVAGLRRGELACLAGVSSHYYARLEQGRDRNPSTHVLEAIARVLQLDDEAFRYLQQLVGARPGRRARVRRPEQVRPELADLICRWPGQPAVVIGRHRDVLAANDLAVALNPDFTPGRNILREMFLEPTARKRYPDWQRLTEGAVAGIRLAAGTELDDPYLADLVAELSLKSAAFRQMWTHHHVNTCVGEVERYHNPVIGEVSLLLQTFVDVRAPGQSLYIFSAPVGSPDERSLELLSSTIDPRGAAPRWSRGPAHAGPRP